MIFMCSISNPLPFSKGVTFIRDCLQGKQAVEVQLLLFEGLDALFLEIINPESMEPELQ